MPPLVRGAKRSVAPLSGTAPSRGQPAVAPEEGQRWGHGAGRAEQPKMEKVVHQAPTGYISDAGTMSDERQFALS
jgi:hypothetical protein